MRARVLAAAFALAAICSLTSAQTFQEDFESYAPGSALHGQGGWKGWGNDPQLGAPTSDKYAHSGTNSVEVIGAADLVREFQLAGGRWIFSALQYIPKDATGSTYLILLNRYADHGVGNDWSVQLNFDLTAGRVTAEAEGGYVTTEVVYGRWVEQRFVIDLIGNTCAWYYGGELIVTHSWDDDAHGTLQAVDLFGNGASSVYYDDITVTPHVIPEAHDPDPVDGATGVGMPLLTWTEGDTAVLHDVYLGSDPDLTVADLVASRQTANTYSPAPGLQPGVTYFWRVDEIDAEGTIHPGSVWHFTTMPVAAFDPIPPDGADGTFQAPTLRWTPPPGSAQHRLYFGEDKAAVQEGEATVDKGFHESATYDAGLLRAGTTYFWRVDEIDNTGVLQMGSVWSFTTGQPISGQIVREWWTDVSGTAIRALTSNPRYPGAPTGSEWVDFFEGPVDWKDNYGSRLYGWLTPPKSGAYTFWISADDTGELWLSTDADPAKAALIASISNSKPRDFDNDAAQKSAAITLQAGHRYYIEAIMKAGSGSDNLAVAWQAPNSARVVIPSEYVDTFGLLPLRAANPSPKNGVSDTAQLLTLSWFAGERAIEHDVYFGADALAVAAADPSGSVYRGRQTGRTWDAGHLEWGKTYFWRVDEIADGEADSPWKGTLWSFTTAEFIPVDDFEVYTDDMDAEKTIFQTWIDGVTNHTGSYVGYEFPSGGTFGETTIVHGGRQSMPLEYNNLDSPYYSETERTWSTAQDWTTHGVDSLVIHVRGRRTNDPDLLYVALADGEGHLAVVPYVDETAVYATDWLAWKIPLSRFAGVNPAKIKTMRLGVGSRTTGVPGGKGVIYIDDIRIVKP